MKTRFPIPLLVVLVLALIGTTVWRNGMPVLGVILVVLAVAVAVGTPILRTRRAAREARDRDTDRSGPRG